jgi:hypothetical protein
MKSMLDNLPPGPDLDGDADYRISGFMLNTLHDMAVRNFNESQTDDTGFSYAQAFWNGYGSAIRGIRETVWPLPDYKYLLPKASDPEVP